MNEKERIAKFHAIMKSILEENTFNDIFSFEKCQEHKNCYLIIEDDYTNKETISRLQGIFKTLKINVYYKDKNGLLIHFYLL